MKRTTSEELPISRRQALGVIGSTVGAFAVVGCGGSDSSTDSSSSSSSSSGSSSSSSSSSGGSSSSCAVTPEGEIGPYFADDSASGFDRSNVLSNLDGTDTQAGVALTLSIYVVDTENDCAALEGAQVDIWHCNAYGVYSDIAAESTTGQTWLRGYQLTDSNGLATFTTIIPGWYEGRTTHIHVRVRSSYSEASSTSDGTNTTQLFFSQTLIDTLNTSVAPYSTHGSNSTTNASDHVYTPETEGETLLTLSGSDSSGYTTSYTVGLPITAA